MSIPRDRVGYPLRPGDSIEVPHPGRPFITEITHISNDGGDYIVHYDQTTHGSQPATIVRKVRRAPAHSDGNQKNDR